MSEQAVSAPVDTPAETGDYLPPNFSALAAGSAQVSQPKPNTGGSTGEAPAPVQEQRSEFIPRERFDEVIQQRNQAQELLQRLAAGQFPAQQQQMPQPGVQHWGGMQVQQAPQPAPQPPVGLNLGNKEEVERWQKRISEEGVPALAEFFSTLAAPVLEQLRQEQMQVVQPIRQTFLQQQVSGFIKSNPDLAPVQDQFLRLVAHTVQNRPNVPINETTLSLLASAARSYGQPVAPQPSPHPAPYTETPGAHQRPAASGPQLTDAQKQMAKRFGLTEDQYLKSLGSLRRG